MRDAVYTRQDRKRTSSARLETMRRRKIRVEKYGGRSA
jgi:hypothetical protein